MNIHEMNLNDKMTNAFLFCQRDRRNDLNLFFSLVTVRKGNFRQFIGNFILAGLSRFREFSKISFRPCPISLAPDFAPSQLTGRRGELAQRSNI